MIDTIYFFAAKEDICNIFHAIEQDLDIKYCVTRADQDADKEGMPRMEFDTIAQIVDDIHATHLIEPFYLITPKTEVMKTHQQALKDRDDIRRYCMDYTENGNSVLLKGMPKHEDLTFDYYVHIERKLETEFSGALFKRIVREIRRNCILIKYSTPIYIGKAMYPDRRELVFHGERCDCVTLTETDRVKKWYRNPNVRAFADQSLSDQLSFLQEVFYGKKIKDYLQESKEFSEDFQIYRVAVEQLWGIKDLSLLKDIFMLFDDDVLVTAPCGTRTAMEELCESSVYVASLQKPDGFRILLEHLCWIPEKGYHCGCEGIVRLLLKKKYYEKFKMGVEAAADDTKKLVKRILEGLTDKKTESQRKELINLLNL